MIATGDCSAGTGAGSRGTAARDWQNLEGIRALIRSNCATLCMKNMREYCQLFDGESLPNELLQEPT